jgi:glutamyl-tRNA synthetase
VSSASPRLRIAPSPTGDPHIGTAYQALFDYAYVRQNGGAFVFRVEDTDQARYNPESERRIYQALHWLGLNWDEGPDIGGPYAPYRQSERLALYAEHAHRLIAQGSAYYCFCTRERLDAMRKAQEAAKLPPRYDRHCAHLAPAEIQARLAAGEPAVVRLRMPDHGETIFHDLVRGPVSFRNELQDDAVILKSDGFPTYHLAVVVDDHLMEITHVVRGEEWISSTPKHIVLYDAFGWALPAFIHMPLLRNADKSKISKRKNNTSLDWYREQGYLPAALLNYLALQGWSMPDARETFSLDEFIASFTWDRIVTGGPIFDLRRLDDLNGQYIRMLSPDQLIDALEPFLPIQVDRSLLQRVIPLIQTRMDRLTQFFELGGFFFVEPAYELTLLTEQKLGAARSHALLHQVRDLLYRLPSWDVATMEQSFRALTEAEGVKMRQTAEVARVAITGSKAGPPLFESMELLGREICLARVDHALTRINTG